MISILLDDCWKRKKFALVVEISIIGWNLCKEFFFPFKPWRFHKPLKRLIKYSDSWRLLSFYFIFSVLLIVFFWNFYSSRRDAKSDFPESFEKICPKSGLWRRFSRSSTPLALYIAVIRRWYLCRMINVILPSCRKKNFKKNSN